MGRPYLIFLVLMHLSGSGTVKYSNLENVTSPAVAVMIKSPQTIVERKEELIEDSQLSSNPVFDQVSSSIKLNNIFSSYVPYSDRIPNEVCSNHSRIFLQELQRFTLWAVSSKCFTFSFLLISSITNTVYYHS